MDELQAGDPARIGPYLLLGRLGAGGMGQVFLGRSPGGRLVAVKVIRAELAGDPGFRARFAREVAAARRVSGVFTAPVVDADPAAPMPWLVTGFVNGSSLAATVEDHGVLPVASVLALAAGLAEGLSAVHAAGVVHRDLKPSNVLLAADGPRVIDFGISQAADVTHMTQTGTVIGSPAFMSPEQAEGRPVGPPSDVFSLGSVLAFAATGEGPFGTGTPTAQLYRVVYGTPRLDQLPGPVRPLVERCLAKDPAQRPTAGQFLAELTAAHPSAADLTDWLPDSMIPVIALPRAAAPATPPAVAATGPSGPGDAWQRTMTAPVEHPRPTPAAPQAGRRRTVSVIAAVAVLGAALGLVVAAPWKSPPPVLRPAGLTANSATTSSVTLRWSSPATGPAPDRYEILQDGQQVGSVAGNVTHYQAAGLAPGTPYHFRVIAIRNDKRSPQSVALSVATLTPPLSAALLGGTWTANYKTTSVSHYETWSIAKDGAKWTDAWTFLPSCSVGACNVTLEGTFNGSDFTASLAHTGAVYTGTAPLDNYNYCVNQSNYVHDTLYFQIQVQGAAAQGPTWAASSWAGTVTLVSPHYPDGNCYAVTIKATVLSSG